MNYKNEFLFELDQELPKGKIYRTQNMFTKFTLFRSVFDIHATLKTKNIRGSHAPFLTKAPSKVMMTRSRLRSKYNK